MSVFKYALPAFAAVSGAMAQSCSTSATMTIQSPSDAQSVGGCKTFTGTIAIATQAAGELDFGGLQAIQGAFNNTGGDTQVNNVTSITANSLQSISEDFILSYFNGLTALNMPQLSSVGNIMFNALSSLSQLNMGKGINASQITVTNTGIQDLSPLAVVEAEQITINNNNALHTLNWPTTNVTNLTVSGNAVSGSSGSVSLAASFANLLGAGTIDLGNVSSLNLQSLYNTSQLLSIVGSPVSNLSFPNYTMASGGGIRIQNNPGLQSIAFPALTSTGTGALDIINNDNLGGAIELPMLSTVGSVFNVTGAFTSIFAPNVTSIKGGSNVQSTGTLDNTTCAVFGPSGSLAASGKIQGKVSCTGNEMGTPGSAQGQSSNTKTSKSASPMGFESTPATLFGSFGLIAAILGIM